MNQQTLLTEAFKKHPGLTRDAYMAICAIRHVPTFHQLKRRIRLSGGLVIPVFPDENTAPVYTTEPSDLEMWAYTHRLSKDGRGRTETNVDQLEQALPMLEATGLTDDVFENYEDLDDSLGRTVKDYIRSLRIIGRRS